MTKFLKHFRSLFKVTVIFYFIFVYLYCALLEQFDPAITILPKADGINFDNQVGGA
jgi:hypothetical protein